MVENLYVAEQLAREKVQTYLNQAEQDRLQRSLPESARPASRGTFGTWLADGSPSNPSPGVRE